MAVLSHWQPTKNKAGFGRRDHEYRKRPSSVLREPEIPTA